MENNGFRLLIVGDKTSADHRFIHLKQFMTELEKIGIKSKLIYDMEFINKFFERNINKKIEGNRNQSKKKTPGEKGFLAGRPEGPRARTYCLQELNF